MLRVLMILVVLAGVARAEDRVVLLPLDAQKGFEIYGQPVASEVARMLRAAKIEIEVIGAKMAVPENARLIVDGTIGANKKNKNDIVLVLRIRNPVDGVTLATVSSTAAGIANVDKATAEVSTRLIAVLQERLAALRTPTTTENGTGTVHQVTEVPMPELRPMLAVVSMTDIESDPLRAALTHQLDAQLRRVYRSPKLVDPGRMSRELATQTVKESGLDLGMILEITSYVVEIEDMVPIARARVRIRVTDAVGIVFDRVVVTDSIVGEKMLVLPHLAERVAREVFDIARPHLKRTVSAWR
ncbi:MAG: hypothetical protein ACKV2T_26935 [Kofleriaceae bacterium]